MVMWSGRACHIPLQGLAFVETFMTRGQEDAKLALPQQNENTNTDILNTQCQVVL